MKNNERLMLDCLSQIGLKKTDCQEEEALVVQA